MRHITLYFLLFLSLSSCFAQKDKVIKEVKPIEAVKSSDFVYADELLQDESHNAVLRINNNRLYERIEDSTLYSGGLSISLHRNFDSDTGAKPYGSLSGDIENGKKVRKWKKEVLANGKYVVVKTMSYSDGVLDGKYQIYDIEGKVLYPDEPHPLYPDEYKDYAVFKKGTGRYYDYYYDTGVLKEEGYYRNGKKYYAWITYDREGNEIKRDYYNNGVIVNE